MKRQVNRVLQRATGYQLQRPAPAAAPRPRKRRRVLVAPAFVISTVRSGSTLLRVLLDSHPEIHSPHEMHLRDIVVELKSKYAERALREGRLDREELQHVLWDWYLGRELAATGKALLVNKTPSDVYVIDEIKACWPDARFIFLLRHPLAIARSRHKLRPEDSDKRNLQMVNRYASAVEQARQTHDGLTVRYEQLAAEPERVTRELCAFLGVDWDAAMLDYGEQPRRRFRAGLGDWQEKIRSGRVQPPEPLPPPEEVPATLRPIAERWGYLPASVPVAPSAPADAPAG